MTHASSLPFPGIATAPGTLPGTPAELSRPTSPSMAGTSGLVSSSLSAPKMKSNLSTERPVKIKAPKSKTDPLRSLPKELSQRIFLSLRVRELAVLSVVCKRYRRSATLNYCWYRQCLAQFDSQDAGSNSGPSLGPSGSGGHHWTRRESRTDWKGEYIKKRRGEAKDREREERGGGSLSSGYSTPSRSQRLADSGLKTAKDVKEEQWAEAAEQEQAGYSKNELRQYYKEQGGSKGGKAKGVKAKSGKGSNRAGEDGLWE